MKKFLIVLVVVLLVLASLFFYQKYKFQQQINQKVDKLTDDQKIEAGNTISDMTSKTNDLKKKFSEMGIPTLPVNKQEIADTVVSAEMMGADAAIKSLMQNAIYATAQLYYGNHQNNYGVSALKNVCVDSSLDSFSQWILKSKDYSKTPAKCVVSSQFPVKTYTVIIPSIVNNGLYCTDQNGFAGLIANENIPFVSGVKCK